MINKSMNKRNINITILNPSKMDETIFKDFVKEITEITSKYLGNKCDSILIAKLRNDFEFLLANNKYDGFCLRNDEFFMEASWSLEKLIRVHNAQYPDRKENKKGYTNIEVNNMLFDLQIKKIIGAYVSPAKPMNIPQNNEIFDENELIDVEVPILSFGIE